MNKAKMIKFLEYSQKLIHLSDKIYELDRDETVCIDYIFILDKVFLYFSGKSWDVVNESYSGPANCFTGKPIAWYGNGYLKSPNKNYRGFIPEVISDVILQNKNSFNGKEMFKILKRLFKDLEKCSNETI